MLLFALIIAAAGNGHVTQRALRHVIKISHETTRGSR
jgi:hypothetical protein